MACGLPQDGETGRDAAFDDEEKSISAVKSTSFGDGSSVTRKKGTTAALAAIAAGAAVPGPAEYPESIEDRRAPCLRLPCTSGGAVAEATLVLLSPAVSAPHQQTERKVRFDAQPITAIWLADSDYDRRSIVVDLSKTPFALFRKDAVMMKSGITAHASARLPPPCPSALPGAASAIVTQSTLLPLKPAFATAVAGEATAKAASSDGVEAVTSSVEPSSCSRRRADLLFSSDSDSSDAGYTDTETDFEYSDSDSGYSSGTEQLDAGGRRGSNTSSNSDGPAFYGVWKRTSSEGYEELLLESGVPKRAVATALRKHPVHIIDHDGTYVRLIVKNGLSKVDNTFFIGDEPRMVSRAVSSQSKLPFYAVNK